MIKEILEIPRILREFIKSPFVFDATALRKIKLAKRILIVGCGTSYHAGLLGAIFFD